jgi:hypothetical protein
MQDDLYSYDRKCGFELVVENVEGNYIGYVYYKTVLKYKTHLRCRGEDCRQEIFDNVEDYLSRYGAIPLTNND